MNIDYYRTTARLMASTIIGAIGIVGSGGCTVKDGAYQVRCEWTLTKTSPVSEARKLDRYDLNIEVKGEPANLLLFVYSPEGKLIYGQAAQSENAITADKMRLSGVASRTVDFSYCMTDGTYTVVVRKQGSDKVVTTFKEPRKGIGSHAQTSTPGTPRDVLTKVHRLFVQEDFTGLAALTPPAFRSNFREMQQSALPLKQHMSRVADLMDAKLGQDAGSQLRWMAKSKHLDPLGRAVERDNVIDWSMVELKEVDSTHLQVGVLNDYGHFVRSCFLTKEAGTWYWLPTSKPDQTPEQMKAEWDKGLAENPKVDAALKDFESGLNQGTITKGNFQEKMKECLARQGLQ